MPTVKSGSLTPSSFHFLCLTPDNLKKHIFALPCRNDRCAVEFPIILPWGIVLLLKFQILIPTFVEMLCLTISEKRVAIVVIIIT